MAMGIVTAGMMFGGTFLLARIPKAAYSFILPISFSNFMVFLLRGDGPSQIMSVMFVVYTMVLVYAVRWYHRQFVQQHLSEAAVGEQSQLISLLLRDFGESTSDCLWQTDAGNRLERIPMNLETSRSAVGFSHDGEDFLSRFYPGEGLAKLQRAFEQKRPFRDLVLQVQVEPCLDCWVSLTGKPIFERGIYRGFRGVAANITQSKEIEDRIAHMAHFDALTGLPNRATLLQHLEDVQSLPDDTHVVRALIWLDLDNFKWVNDTLGHPAGDDLLRQVSKRLTDAVVDGDLVARLGGDEFAMVVERSAAGELETFLDLLVGVLGKPYTIYGSTANCAASIGVRLFDPFTVDTRTLAKHADLALYHAKSMGKGQWAMFTQELEERAQARLRIQAELEHAIEHDEFRLVFQPQLNAKTRKLAGFETLLRWQHPERGIIGPSEFINLAEDNGLITRIGEWVIRAALEEAGRMPEHLHLAINLSPVQIHSTSLMSTIISSLAANGVAPERIEFEITESVLLTDTDFVLQRLHQLKDLGIRISLDDFGTGYSSLSYLRRFPFDKIKIDQSFVRDIETNPDSRAITLATLTMARSLGLRCTAEGVETFYQAEFLTENGCDELQGYFVGRPHPIESFRHLIGPGGRAAAAPVRQERRHSMAS